MTDIERYPSGPKQATKFGLRLKTCHDQFLDRHKDIRVCRRAATRSPLESNLLGLAGEALNGSSMEGMGKTGRQLSLVKNRAAKPRCLAVMLI